MYKFKLIPLSLFLSATLCFSLALAESKKGLKAVVELSPAGSFEVLGTKFKGGPIIKKRVGLSLDKMIVPSESLKTGVDLRDEHLKKRLKGDIIIEDAKAVGGQGKAFITLAGTRKEINFNYDHPEGKMIVIKFTLNMKDFGITDINYMGVGVKDAVNVEATLPVKEEL
jgi:hypothetical protein